MARLGPWDESRRVAVAVSGGADSLALALLARDWGDPQALIVDHGLRAGSAAEAEGARAALQSRGIAARILRLDGLSPGSGLPARARGARYAALSAACRAAGLVDLLLGHHAGDQAETVLMRQRRGSRPAGLAGMAAVTEADDIRLLRPLLAFDPARLRATVAAAGLVPAEDPTNTDVRYTRARLRQEIGAGRGPLLALAAASGTARTASDHAVAAELAARAAIFPEGFAVVSPGPIGEAALAALLRRIGGRPYPVSGIAGLAAALRPATVAGVRIMPAGRLGPGWLLVRERAAPPIAAVPGAVWDGRYRVVQAQAGTRIGALGFVGARRSRTGPPAAVLAVSPAVWSQNDVALLPHADNCSSSCLGHYTLLASAGPPVAGAAFLACS